MRSQASFVGSLLVVLSFGVISQAHDGEGDRQSRLVPPDGAAAPRARGAVQLGHETFILKVEGLPAGDYKVCLDDGTGTLAAIGTISVHAEDDHEDDGDDGDGDDGNDGKDGGDIPGGGGDREGDHEDGGDDHEDDGIESEGVLKLGADALPFGATSPLDLSGRAIAVKDAGDAVVLVGKTPSPIVKEPDEHVGHCPLSRPEAAADPDAEGVLKLESREGRIVIKVRVEGLDSGAVYGITLTNPADGVTETIGMVTIDEEGGGRFKIDTAEGDAVPFGATDLAALVGFKVAVKSADGVVVLAGTVCPAETREDGEEHGADEPCEANLARPEPAPDADATGEVEIEGEELEVEVERLAPLTAYDVVLIQPGDGGASATIGQVKTGEGGRGELEFEAEEGAALPFGKTKISELVGHGVEVKDATGAVVLKGAIPEMACAPEKEDGGDDGHDGDDGDGDDGDGEDDNPPGADEPCEADLARPEPAPDADAAGEVEIEGEELEVELAGLAPLTAYDVVLIQPGEGGGSAAIGQVKTGEGGRAVREFEVEEGVVLPFGKTKISELVGHGVEVKDATGVVVLKGAIPEIACEAEEEDRKGEDGHDGEDGGDKPGGGGLAPLEEPIFVMLGRFDATFLRGDANRDAAIDISDALGVLEYLFIGGARPYCLDAADANDDGSVNITDAIGLLDHLFLGGSRPTAPGTLISGSDPTPDALYCEERAQAGG